MGPLARRSSGLAARAAKLAPVQEPVADEPVADGAALAEARGFARGTPDPGDAAGAAILKDRTDSGGRTATDAE